jgi:hypothetical protein
LIITGDISTEVKRLKLEVGYSPPFNTVVKNEFLGHDAV